MCSQWQQLRYTLEDHIKPTFPSYREFEQNFILIQQMIIIIKMILDANFKGQSKHKLGIVELTLV
jgi:hypothetical protein